MAFWQEGRRSLDRERPMEESRGEGTILDARDVDRIEEILRATGVFIEEEVQVAREMVEEALERQDYRVGCTRDSSGRLTGYILWGRTPFTRETCDLYWMAVDPALHGQGIGRRLIRIMEADMRSRGERFVRIETSSLPTYRKTRDFYRAVGYPEVVRLPHFYAPGNDLCLHYGEIPTRME